MVRARRRPRHLAAAAAVVLLLAACGGDDDPVVVDPPDDTASDVEEEVEDDDPTAEDADTGGEVDEPDDGGVDDAGDAASEDGDGGAAAPSPDPALVDDPCGPHEDRTDEGFIEVVSPVAEQEVGGDVVDLVGCSNVFEATVSWTLYDGDGRTLDSGFTTAECGSGCVGAFETEVPLDAAAGEPYAELHVFSEDMSDAGGELFLTAVPLVLG